MNAHEGIQFKITSILFNRRADALRDEMYRAMCLSILGEFDSPRGCDQIIEEIIAIFGIQEDATESLRTILIEEINRLVEDGKIEKNQENQFFLVKDAKEKNQNNSLPQDLTVIINEEIKTIATNIKNDITDAEIKILNDFYLEVTDVVAKHQVYFAAKGSKIQEIDPTDDNIQNLVSECVNRYKVADIIDLEKFIQRSLIRPSERLADYIYKLLQVAIISQLLTWDPSLDYLRTKLLAGKKLYLDSSILFCLVLETHPLHTFLKSLLTACKKELGVILNVHETTINEFQLVVDAYNSRFINENKLLRDIAKSCKLNNNDPADYLEASIFVDYVSKNLEHIDLGSWQRYYNSISRKSLENSIKSLGISIQHDKIFVPTDDFWRIKDALARAGKTQLERGKRKFEKTNLDHDARIFHLISNLRKKNGGDLSLSYDTFLLTMDGSLPFFLKEFGIPWTETYFMFPGQWYQLTFPFLRIPMDRKHKFSLGMAFMAYSTIFPSIAKLVPLELCEYIFEQGGSNLSMGSVSTVTEKLLEERIITSLDPLNKDIGKKEVAKNEVQRIIAQQEMVQKKSLVKLEQEKYGLESTRKELVDSIEDLEREQKSSQLIKDSLEQEIAQLRIELDEIKKSSQMEVVTKSEILNNQNELQSENNETNKALENQVQILTKKFEDLEKEKEDSRKVELRKKEHNKEIITKTIISAFLIPGLLLALSFMISSQIGLNLILITMLSMLIGLVVFVLFKSPLISYSIFACGACLFLYSYLTKTQDNLAYSFIPLGLQIIGIIVERVVDKTLSN